MFQFFFFRLRNLKDYYPELMKKNVIPEYDHPYNVSPLHRKAASKMLDCFRVYTDWILGKMMEYFKNNKSESDLEQQKKNFLKSVSDSNRPFVSALIATQQFSVLLPTLINNQK